jgi:hypothetical protein
MSIEDLSEKIKGLAHFKAPELRTLPDDLFLGLTIVLIAIGSFGLGRLSKIEGAKTPIRIENAPAVEATTFSKPATGASSQSASILGATGSSGTLVASKSGTKYYYTWCSGVQKIAVANRVYFNSIDDAKAAGYTPSNTCKGL